MDENTLSREIVDAALEVHKELGPGLLESIYQQSLAHELQLRSLRCEVETPIEANYKGLNLESAYRLDLLVEDKVIIEVKAVETILPVHKAQLLSYLKLSNLKLGLLINFHVPLMKYGIKRVVHRL
jgi:GxxExxY protein